MISLVINGNQAKTSMQELRTAAAALSRSLNQMRESDNPARYREKVQELRRVNQTYREMRGEIFQTTTANQRFMQSVKSVAAGVIGGNLITGFFTTLRSEIDRSVEVATRRADQLSDIQKTTGLIGDDLVEVEKRLSSIDTRTSREELRRLAWQAGKLGIEGVDNISKFVEEANKVNVALGEDLGADAMIKIGKAAMQLDVDILNLASGFNALGMASSAQEGFMLEFTSRMAPLGKTANITAAEILGFAGTIDAAGLNVEMSATAMNKFFIDFTKNTDEFGQIAGFAAGELSKIKQEVGTNEAFLRMLEQLKALNPKAEDFLQKLEELGIDGARGSQVFLSLANNLGEVRRQQELATEEVAKGTSVIDEYNIKNENLAAQHEKNKKALQSSLKPFRLFLAETTVSFTGWLANSMQGIFSLIRILTIGGAAWLTYRTAMLAARGAQLLFNNDILTTGIIMKAQKVATLAAAAAKALFARDLARASAAMRVFNSVVRANPFGLMVSALGAVFTGLALFKNKTEAATKELSSFNKIRQQSSEKAKEALIAERSELDLLFMALRATNSQSEERSKLISQINTKYGTTLTNLSDEKGFLKEIDGAYEEILKKMMDRITLSANDDLLKDLIKERTALQQTVKIYDEFLETTKLTGMAQQQALKSFSEQYPDFNKDAVRYIDLKKEMIKIDKQLISLQTNSANILANSLTSSNIDPTESNTTGKKNQEIDNKKDQRLEKLRKQLTSIEDEIAGHRRRLEIEGMDADAQEVARLDDKFEKLLNELDVYNQEVLASKDLTEKEKLALTALYDQMSIEAMEMHQEEVSRLEKEKQGKNKEQRKKDQDELMVALMTNEEKEIFEINKHYDALELLAKGNAEQMAKIALMRAAAIDKVNQDSAEKAIQLELNKAEAVGSAMKSSADMFAALNNFVNQGNEEQGPFFKAVALAQIAADTAMAISSAMRFAAQNKANGVTAGVAGLIQFATVSTAIFSAMSNAQRLLFSVENPTAPDMTTPQFYGGGFTYAYGAQDGKQYKAQQYGSIANGGSFNSTGLGLLAEKGPEFVIPNSVYSNPANQQLMQMLSGAMSVTGGSNTSTTMDNSEMVQLLKVIAANVSKPVRAATYFDQRSYEEYLSVRNRAQNVARLNNNFSGN